MVVTEKQNTHSSNGFFLWPFFGIIHYRRWCKMKFIDIKNCYKVYKNGVTAIADLTLQIDKGEFVFIARAIWTIAQMRSVNIRFGFT